MNWVPFDTDGELPPKRRCVLVQIASREHLPPCVAVGYLQIWGTDEAPNPWFVVPGMGGPKFTVTHWCDCLGDNFHAPLYPDWKPNAPRTVTAPKLRDERSV